MIALDTLGFPSACVIVPLQGLPSLHAWTESLLYTSNVENLLRVGGGGHALSVASRVLQHFSGLIHLFSSCFSCSVSSLLEVQGRHARLQQCLHSHHQCNHDQPRPTVDGAAHSYHLHVQPLLPLPPVRSPPDQRPGAAGAQHAGSTGGHPLHRGRQGPTQKG